MSDRRALLLTDVVDSTQLSEQIGDAAMAEVWVAHDRAARALLVDWRGREIDKTDGMLLLFEQAADAAGYALAYHQALAALARPLRARAGLHVGPVILRENAPEDVARGAKPLEVDGLAKPTAARVMSLAQGGQTLLTADARQALGPSELHIESHGHWMVKGLADPIELFEAAPPGQRCVAPADSDKVFRVVRAADWWMPVREIPNNLPFQSTSFIGREQELDDLKALLGRSRVLTLLGMGGLGKTRLSLQLAAAAMHQYPDGVWFLDLSPLRDPALVVSEAAQLVGAAEQAGQPLLQTLCAHLKSRRSLLVIDNCEHLMAPSIALVVALLRAAPHLRIVATSREALHVPGEQAYPILPLPLPARSDGAAALMRSAAVRLFVERARAHRPAFELGEREAPVVAELVARLEGIPLALELAAARVRVLSVADINARLKDRYKILVGGARGLQERQQTLRALVDWSYDLLNESEQRWLARLGVFVGGFDLEGAEQVCGFEPSAGEEALDVIGSLTEKSLLSLDERPDGTRYRMLETIRDYALDKLSVGGEHDAVAARHCQHFFDWSKRANRGLQEGEHASWLRRIEDEMDNIRAAQALVQSGAADPFVAVKICVAMLAFWLLRGQATEGRAAVRAALALPAVQAAEIAQAHALYVGAALAGAQSDNAEAQQMLEVCLTLRRGLGNPVDIAATLSTLSLTRLQMGNAAGARGDEQEALELFRQIGDRRGEAIGHLHLGQIEAFEGRSDAAREHLNAALALARALQSDDLAGECEFVLGQVAWQGEGDAARAGQHMARALQLAERAGDRRGEVLAHWWQARLALRAAASPDALAQLVEAARALRDFRMQAELLGALEDGSRALALAGATAAATRLAAATGASRQHLGLERAPHEERDWQQHLAALGAALGDDGFDQARREGQDWSVDQSLEALDALATPEAAAAAAA